MRYFLIDPNEQRITVRESIGNIDLKLLRSEIGCKVVQRQSLGGNVGLWIDDEGLLTATNETHFHALKTPEGKPSPLAGKGLICGPNRA